MKLIPFIACLLLAGCSAAPSSNGNLVIKDKHFKNEDVIYSGQHDIVRMFVPLNQFNFDEMQNLDESGSEENEHPYTLFFVEGDFNENKEVINQGLYIYKGGKATKLLDNGRDITTTQSNAIYFGAEDGIYKYDNVTNTATKYGTVTDNIIQLAHNNKTDSIYYLTDDFEVYKLNDDATASVKVPDLKDVQEMVFDFKGKLYYYNSKKEFYVVDIDAGGTPKKIRNLPAELDKITLVSPFYGMEEGATLYVDGFIYYLDNDYARKSPVETEVPITATAPQPTLIQYHAKDKKIYEINVGRLMQKYYSKYVQEALDNYKKMFSSVI